MIEDLQMSLYHIHILQTQKKNMVLRSHFRNFLGERKTSLYLHPHLYALVSREVTPPLDWSLSSCPVALVTHPHPTHD